ncbi:recombinase family protein [Neorhizobium galegae]|uniref:recombinase family protein n=1 Tax=Neorhizobium galegae TaxID=399 RepID=UPI001F329D07|nr:recombinase family protein [Neorhizobium galegae]UIK04820.1 recombinase family protein [Neorhizobium galegae]
MTTLVSGRVVGYARVSTRGQDLGYQLDKLNAAGCAKVFHEKRSGKNRDDRPELAALLQSLHSGDLVLATVTDRLARDPLDMLNIVAAVQKAGAGLRLLDEPFIDTTSEFSDLILFIIGWAARWQRLRILENTAHGRELARQRGVKFGRKPKLGPIQQAKAAERRANGEPCALIARAFGVSESTINRIKPTSQGSTGDIVGNMPE